VEIKLCLDWNLKAKSRSLSMCISRLENSIQDKFISIQPSSTSPCQTNLIYHNALMLASFNLTLMTKIQTPEKDKKKEYKKRKKKKKNRKKTWL